MPAQDKEPITLYDIRTETIYLNRQHIRQRRCNFRSAAGAMGGGGSAALMANPNDLT